MSSTRAALTALLLFAGCDGVMTSPDAEAPRDGGSLEDAGPVAGPRIASAQPTSVALGAPLTIEGERLAGVTSLTIGGVSQTLGAQDDASLRVASVDPSTPLGTQSLVAEAGDGASASIDVVVLSPLSVSAASGLSTTRVAVLFSRALDAASVGAEDFTIDGLAVTAASVAGAMVSLETAEQTEGGAYEVVVAGVADTFGNPLGATDRATFSGFEVGVPAIASVDPTVVVVGSTTVTVDGVNLLGATVTVGGEAQAVLLDTASQLVFDVAAATPTGTQPMRVSTDGGASGAVDLEVLAPFEIVGVEATSASRVEVTFNRDVGSAPSSGFAIPGLPILTAEPSGAVVSLSTDPQLPGATYALTADITVVDGHGAPTDGEGVSFAGFASATPTELVVVRVGDGSGLDGNAAPVFLERRRIDTGAVVGALALPTTASAPNQACTLIGNYPYDGALTRSEDGRLLALGCYPFALGTGLVDGPRVVAVVDLSDFGSAPTLDTSTTLGTTFSTTRVFAAVAHGSSIWVGGGFGGVHHVARGGSTTTRVSASSGPSPGRALGIFGGGLFYSAGMTSTTEAQLAQIGAGLPTASEAATTTLHTSTSPYSFHGFDRSADEAGIDVFYQANDATGLERWVKADGTFTLSATFGPPVRHVTCFEDGADVVCVASRPDGLFVLRDVGGSMAGASMTALASGTPAVSTNFRGVALVPIP